MKKTLLALSVLLASTAANAGIEVYNKDGATVNIGGDLEVVYKKSDAKNSSPEQQIQDADIKFDIRYAVNEEVSVGGFWEFQGDQNNTTDGGAAIMGDVYFAVYTANMGTLKVGDTCTFGDDLGMGSDYQFGLSEAISSSSAFCGDEVVKYSIDTGMFYGGVAYRDNQRDTNSTTVTQVTNKIAGIASPTLTPDGSTSAMFDMNVGVRVAGFDLLAYYGDVARTDDDILALEAKYGMDAWNFELGFYTTDGKLSTAGGDTFAGGVDYTVNAWKFAVGFADQDFNDATKEDFSEYFVNAGYKVAPGTTLYAEIADSDKKNTDTAYAAGVKVEF